MYNIFYIFIISICIIIIFIFMLTITLSSACSFLTVMKIIKSIIILNIQSFEAKLCAVAVNG